MNKRSEIRSQRSAGDRLSVLCPLPDGFSTNSSGNYVVKLREVTDCAGGTTVYRQALVSEPYAAPPGNT